MTCEIDEVNQDESNIRSQRNKKIPSKLKEYDLTCIGMSAMNFINDVLKQIDIDILEFRKDKKMWL